MSTNKKTAGGFSSLVAFLTIVIALILGVIIFTFILGEKTNFADLDPVKGKPLNFMGTMYKGGFIVPILIAVNFIIIIFSIERYVTLAKSKGRGKIDNFVIKIKNLLESKEIHAAIDECDKQRGSIGNVVKAGLTKYEHIQNDTELNKEQKVESIKKELEEATALELPMLSKNLVVISTCASIATLIGLIGTVLGMIKSFSAMSQGSPDTSELAVGISEALINTFLGIAGSAIAIIMFNIFSTKIDQMTYSMDEASFTIVQDFAASTK
ncbi:MAG: MotA/TolQ/ExbB proton channel family protein [Flavobacteriia bacterium]|nr:MotA/TolQ/ExbB proton channel family protein [Flavobacteriia bacterium]